MKPLVVGTRGSRLALIQTQEVVERLKERHPGLEFRVKALRTGGDRFPEAPIRSLGLGVFVKEIEEALLRGEVDMAVHSLKDLTTALPEGLSIGAVGERLDARDVLINRWGLAMDALPPGARIGASSPRRVAQLNRWSPRSQTLSIRGNVDTRVAKAGGPDYDGIVVAAAGVIRLGLADRVSEYLPTDRFVPAPGQGALAVEIRVDDYQAASILMSVDHGPTRRAVTAERAFLERLGGGCSDAAAAYARVSGDTMVITVFVASPDGGQVYVAKAHGRAGNPHEVAMEAHQRLIERGAAAIMSTGREE